VHLHTPPRDNAALDHASLTTARKRSLSPLANSDPSTKEKAGSFEVVLNLRHWTGKSYSKIINAANNLRVSDSEAFLHHSKVASGDSPHHLPFPMAFAHDASPSPLLSGLHTHFHSKTTGDGASDTLSGHQFSNASRSIISHARSRSHGDSASTDSLSDDKEEGGAIAATHSSSALGSTVRQTR
jgi:hypothetical protein